MNCLQKKYKKTFLEPSKSKHDATIFFFNMYNIVCRFYNGKKKMFSLFCRFFFCLFTQLFFLLLFLLLSFFRMLSLNYPSLTFLLPLIYIYTFNAIYIQLVLYALQTYSTQFKKLKAKMVKKKCSKQCQRQRWKKWMPEQTTRAFFVIMLNLHCILLYFLPLKLFLLIPWSELFKIKM